ncbi:MAG: S9 family peptidase, partial [Blastocatellia bacterium]|nr:S9 family peptidase [Blastocatellia bacterium]
MKPQTIVSLLLTLALIETATMAQEQVLKPPVAKKVPKTTRIHDYTVVDDYAWLEDKSKTDPEVLAYLKAEDDYADSVMKPSEAFRNTLYQEMLARIKETDENVPYRMGDYFYYSRTEKGKQYPIYSRRKGSLQAPEEITLELNKLAEGKQFFSIGAYRVSEDANLLAYTTDTTGFRQYKLNVKDLRTGQTVEDIAERVTSVAWANDNKTLIYVQEDATTKRPHKVFRHVLGSGRHDLLYEEKDELYHLSCHKTRSSGYIFVVSESSTTSESRYLSANRPNDELKLFLPRRENHEYYVDHIGDLFYIRTNDQGKNFRLVTAPVVDPAPAGWKEIIPHRKEVMLEDLDCFADHFIALEREKGIPRMRVTDLKSGEWHYIEFPEPVYVVSPAQNAEFATTKYRISYQSFITPDSVFDYDVKTKERELLKQEPVLGGYDMKNYKSERLYATA